LILLFFIVVILTTTALGFVFISKNSRAATPLVTGYYPELFSNTGNTKITVTGSNFNFLQAQSLLTSTNGNVMITQMTGRTFFDNVTGDYGLDVYLIGHFSSTLDGYSSVGGTDIFVKKINIYGSSPGSGTRTFGSSQNDKATGIAIDAYENVYASGTVFGNTTFYFTPASPNNIITTSAETYVLLKLQPNTNYSWCNNNLIYL
jgi:hypothetical protein